MSHRQVEELRFAQAPRRADRLPPLCTTAALFAILVATFGCGCGETADQDSAPSFGGDPVVSTSSDGGTDSRAVAAPDSNTTATQILEDGTVWMYTTDVKSWNEILPPADITIETPEIPLAIAQSGGSADSSGS